MYALFAWEADKQKGGIGDLIKIGSVDECQKTFQLFQTSCENPAIGEIADMDAFKIVLQANVIGSKDTNLPAWIAPTGWLIEWTKPQPSPKSST